MNEPAGIYLHIPFCATRCHYCNFATGGYESDVARRYVAALGREIENITPNPGMTSVDTLYFGGGTPTTLSTEQISSLVETCHKKFEIDPGAEITIEANPDPSPRIISEDCAQSESIA